MNTSLVRCKVISRAVSATTRHSNFSTTTSRHADFTHIVIGGGVVGLATARHLTATNPSASTLLLERHAQVGTETSSRNSEVIHAGIYYGPGTLKTELCVRGRHLLYDFCRERGVAHRKTGKWLVAQDEGQREALQKIHDFCTGADGRGGIDVPLRWVGEEEARRLEPNVRAAGGVLESPETGIVDSHGLMVALQGLFEEDGGTVALGSAVQAVEPLGVKGAGGWKVTVRDRETGEESAVTAETVINAAGLGAAAVRNMFVPTTERRDTHYAKGNYFSYSGGTPLRVNRLIYPAPEPGAAGLGTHLTLDLSGRIRFGPDVEWVSDPNDLAVSAARLPQAVEAIRKYLPGLDAEGLTPDYAGMRPKLSSREDYAAGKGQSDFVVEREPGYEGWINLLGIESPGLTSSMAIAERVGQILYGR
ncbi:FAD dependent oxidoreductase [Plectosphaerella plurivora]|uniref:L-2-hydroxyglutarate dehydrogenase, mitochondrial n=1 Tax=Plectosphaerella plurivora TaxID=936078 RepID=A0A9P9A841_9PEZI|nr:FAD dependent oxidoreductase [Plectosphaerella plurivora]